MRGPSARIPRARRREIAAGLRGGRCRLDSSPPPAEPPLSPEAPVVEIVPKQPVPVFPLPDVVLFPHAVVPLHIFELRYRTMLRDALAGERLIAMALLKPGWEHDYFGSPAFHPLGCLGRCEAVEWLPDERYDIRLLGLARVRFGATEREFPYRQARVEVLPEAPYTEDDPLVASERSALLDVYRRLIGR